MQGADKVQPEVWNRVLKINLTAPFLLTHLALQEFLRADRADGAKGGCIINVSSVAGLRGAAAGAAYTTSKWGLVGLTKNTAAYYANKGIRCNAVCPGFMDTNMGEADSTAPFDEEGMQLLSTTAAVNPGYLDVEKVGEVVSFLCSEAAEDVNGAVIPVDKGWIAF